MTRIPYGAKTKTKASLSSTFLVRLTHPRQTHLYGVGTGKSGTHSLAAISSDHLRSAHEPERARVVEFILAAAAGRINEEELTRFVLKRDRRLWLEVDSSHLNCFFLDKLVKLFTDAKFILTIRDPYAWLDSLINMQLGFEQFKRWIRLHNLRFRPDIHTHTQFEQPLKDKGLYTLDGYLAYWARHNRTVIGTVPKERLLIIRTEKLGESLAEIAEFAGISESSLNGARSHAFKARKKFHVLRELDQKYLGERIAQHCGDLMGEFFPEIQLPTSDLAVHVR